MDERVSFGEMAIARQARRERERGRALAATRAREKEENSGRGFTVFREFATQVDRKIRDE